MAESVALQILKALETRLNAASVTIDGTVYTPPSGLTVERERIGPVQPKNVADGPLIILHIGGQGPTHRKHYKDTKLDRVLKVLVTLAADANTNTNAEALDDANNWLITAIQSEPTFNYLAHWVSEEGQEDFYSYFEDSALVVAVREIKLDISFHTRTDDPTTRS